MLSILKSNLPGLTVFSLVLGLFFGFASRARPLQSKSLTEVDFIREVERGAHMNIIVQGSAEFDRLADSRDELAQKVQKDEPIILPVPGAPHASPIKITVPDADAESFFGCHKGEDRSFFIGEVGHKTEAFVSENAPTGRMITMPAR